MDSDRWNRWLTLLANLGVVAGLVLVAIELRQTRDAALGAAYQFRAAENINWSQWIAESDHMIPMMVSLAESGIESLTTEDRRRNQSAMLAAIHRLDGFYYQYELGLLDEEYYETVFRTEMETWVPRWREFGMLEEPWIGYMRSSFQEEIERFVSVDVRL